MAVLSFDKRKLTSKAELIVGHSQKTGELYLTDGGWMLAVDSCYKLPNALSLLIKAHPEGFMKGRVDGSIIDASKGPNMDNIVVVPDDLYELDFTDLYYKGKPSGYDHRDKSVIFVHPLGRYVFISLPKLETISGLLHPHRSMKLYQGEHPNGIAFIKDDLGVLIGCIMPYTVKEHVPFLAQALVKD
jgi:hypothetical protein